MTKRRPGRDPEMDNHSKKNHSKTVEPKASYPNEPKATGGNAPKVSVVDVDKNTEHKSTEKEDMNQQANDVHAESTHAHEPHNEHQDTTAEPKVEINFKGSEVLRAKFPKPFEVAEKIATDWVHDGRFEGIELGHPLAQYFAAKGLRKAKEIEKKVLESPVTEKVAMSALTAGMKAQEIINQVRAKIKK